MTKTYKFTFFVLFLFLSVVFAYLALNTVSAQTPTGILTDGGGVNGGLVNCSGLDCNACKFVELGNNLIKWLFGIVAFIFGILMLKAGFGLVVSGGNTSAVTSAKTSFTNAIIGLLIVMAAWLIVDTIFKTLFNNNGNLDDVSSGWGPWNEIKCTEQNKPQMPEGTGTGPGGVTTVPSGTSTTPIPGGAAQCSDPASLVAKYKGSPVGKLAPGLQEMISCYLSDPTVASLRDAQTVYTVDSNPLCSPTNGNPVCGACKHSRESCHYGGGTGLGSMAADFNAKDRSVAGERALYNALVAMKAKCGGRILFENNHSHISLATCPKAY